MRKLLLLGAALSGCMAANAFGCPGPDRKDYADWGKLKLVENQLSDKDGNPVQLKGWSTYSINPYDVEGCLGENQWELMKKYGANIVRLVLYAGDDNSYKNDRDKYKDLVKNSIKELAEKNMYCLIDWQKSDPTASDYNFDPNDYLNDARDFFNDISKFCFENEYKHVLYEICGEPTCGWSKIKSYAESVLPVITANQPDAIVVVGTDQWCQKIMEPVSNPLSSQWKKNVVYSFHYDACNHYSLLGDFRYAQKLIPVFVSEWTAMKFNGDGPFCADNSDLLMASCDKQQSAPQVVSWCIGNWGKKDKATSFFVGSCAEGSESQDLDQNGYKKYGEYVLSLMEYCKDPEPDTTESKCPGVYNIIPSTEANIWHWDYYDCGGEGVAYHDLNRGAYKKDGKGNVVDYSNDAEEVDVFSLAKQMQWLDDTCPWSTVVDGKVVAYDESISTGDNWKDSDGNPTYKSLNAGRNYYGTDASIRPDEGVDLCYANCRGTIYENLGYSSLGWVEEGEWINYTVKVEKPGLYKISGIINSEYLAPGKNGEISIVSSRGNLLRVPSFDLDPDAVTTFGFQPMFECDDKSVNIKEPWNCWTIANAKSGRENVVLCVFPEAGEQTISIVFSGDAGGVGPLIFDWYGDINYEDPFCCSFPGDVNDIDATKFSINPNPTSGEFTLTLADNVEASVEVVNMAGQVVASQKIVGSASINKSLTAGVYTVIVKSNGGVSTQKLVVK
ncbi:MAG: cellulase family glycosylhydrolase [Bacteroidales bacterium]|nr:cellulase family glycosylhydrolase [Bacteroidales bacterium]